MTDQEMLAEIARLTAENAQLKVSSRKGFGLKISEKGGILITGLRRFPLLMYRKEYEEIMANKATIDKFIADNASKIKDAPTAKA